MIFTPYDYVAPNRVQLNGILNDGSTAAWYQPGIGVTGTLNASKWANWTGGTAGTAGDLLQASGAAQPIVLPWSTSNYLWSNLVPANGMSTLTFAALQNTGPKEWIVEITANDYTPSTGLTVLMANAGPAAAGWSIYISSSGQLVLFDAGANANYASNAANGVTDGTKTFFKFKHQTDNGAGGRTTQFYKSTDYNWTAKSGTWTQIGGDIVTATATPFVASTNPLGIGYDIANGSTYPFGGQFHRGQIYNGFSDAGGTLIIDFNPSLAVETSTNGATFVSSDGLTYTLNNTAVAAPAMIVGSPMILTNGVDEFMQATYTANQPRTYYIVGYDLIWNAGKYIADGVTANTLGLSKTTGTPKLSINAGSAVAENAGFTLGAKHILTIGLNGASSFTTIDNGTAVTGNAGAGNPGGLTLGADGGSLNFGAFVFKEVIDRAVADSAAKQTQICNLLKSLHGTP